MPGGLSALPVSGSGKSMACRSCISLKRRADFARVYRDGKSWANDLVVVRSLENGLGCSRYGLAVSRGVGGAVVRNRVKRRLRAVLGAVRILKGWDVVFTARSLAAMADFADLSRAVSDLLGRARLLDRGA